MVSPRKRKAANRKHFTEANVWKLPVKSKQYLVWDTGTDAAQGLAILISPKTATKSYRVAYYFPGSSKEHYKHLGRVGELALDAARTAAREVRAMAKRGQDPRAGDPTRADTFTNAVDLYIRDDQIGRKQNKSARQTEKVMLSACAAWAKRPIGLIRHQEIRELLALLRDGDEQLGLRKRPYLANRLYSHLRAFFRWCVRVQMLPASPMAEMERPWSGATRRTRSWFAGAEGDKAITALWNAADQIGGTDGRFLKTMLLVGKRKTALASMRWENIDGQWFWNAPQRLTSKSKRLHSVPLPKKAQEVLHPRRGGGAVFENLELDKLKNKIRKASGITDFFYHGVRHLLESKLAELKIPPHIRDQLFDHAPNRGSGAVYDHYQYRAEMLMALNRWADHIDKLRQPGKNVVPLR